MASLGPIWEYRRIVLPSTVDDGEDALSNNMKVAICRFPLGQYRPSPVQTSRIEKVILLQVLLSLSFWCKLFYQNQRLHLEITVTILNYKKLNERQNNHVEKFQKYTKAD